LAAHTVFVLDEEDPVRPQRVVPVTDRAIDEATSHDCTSKDALSNDIEVGTEEEFNSCSY